ncbi:MAG TPA: sugar phosphate nucleotidyltransferase [Armatimonadota bacterium]|jgi:mannose-1-phosphate guanylyltransferase/phosphomannomutase
MKAVVMAGGEGSRLRPLTLQCPKPLVPVANKPVMHHILDLLRRHGITEIVVTLHYLADQILATFGDGSDLGLNLHYTLEETPLGTAGSVKQAEAILKDEPFLIVSGDALTDIDLTALAAFHDDRGADVTLALKQEPNPLEYGVVVTDAEGRVKRFLEKPDWTEAFSNTVNTGIYCLNPIVFSYMQPGVPYDWSHDIFPQLLKEGKPIYGYVAQGYWCDIGSLHDYRQSQMDALQSKLTVELPGDSNSEGCWVGEAAIIDPGARIEAPVLIGAGAHVKQGAHIAAGSVLGDYCVVEAGARILGSTLWNGVYVGEDAQIEGAIVCRHSIVGRASRLEDGVILGERSQTQAESSVATGVKVWPNKVVESGTRLTMSLISGTKWSGSIFSEGAVRGIPNVEITPEYTTKLASAYGSSMAPGSRVVVSRDNHPACRMIKRALLSGLMSSGVNVINVHATPEAVTRYLTSTSAAQGGVHIHMSTSRPSLVTLEFMDAEGVAISKSAQRKIENLFGREDYRRAEQMNIGRIDVLDEAAQQYRRGLRRFAESLNGVGARTRVLLDCAHGTISSIAPALLGEMGYRPVAINAYPDPSAEPRTAMDKMHLLEDLAAMVPTLGAELGALLDEDATALHVVDDTGRVLTEHVMLMAMADLVLRTEPGAVIAVPAAAPAGLEALAEKYGGSVVRTRNSERSLVTTAVAENAAFGGHIDGRVVMPRFQGAADGVAGLIALLSCLNQAQTKLSQVVNGLPPIYLGHMVVPCSWEHKGEIIRRLGEETSSEEADLNEGVMLRYSDGWVLILPDATAPAFHIHAEARTPQRLRELTRRYTSRLEALEAGC